MVDAPCSRVGHIYRKYSPFGGSGKGDYLGRNYKRVAAVWMDEYAEYVYTRRPHYRDMDPGDISQQVGEETSATTSTCVAANFGISSLFSSGDG